MDYQESEDLNIDTQQVTVRNLKCDVNNDLHTKTFIEKLRYIKSNITVEPVVLLSVIPSIITVFSMQNLNLDKACQVNLNFSEDVCTYLRLRIRSNYSSEEDEVQKIIASMEAWRSVIQCGIPTILMMFIGAWSDKTGRRKICILMPVFGEFMRCILDLTSTYFFHEIPAELTNFMDVICPSLSGGWYVLTLACFSYVGDITVKESRTFRLGILSLCLTIGLPLGTGISGILLRCFGYYGVFGISAFMHLLNIIYICFFIKDHRWLARITQRKKNLNKCTTFLASFFDFNSLKETTQIALEKGPNNRRLKICLILIGVCLTYGITKGELNMLYIFCRYRFNWNYLDYSLFFTYNLVTHAIGTVFSISFFNKRLKVDDSVLGIISTSSKIFGCFVMAFARNKYDLYLAPLVEILNGTASIALRSIASKLVSPQELGKVYSLFGIAETMSPFMFTPLYSSIYISTLQILPGAIFLVSAMLAVLALGIFILFYIQHKRSLKEKKINTLLPSRALPAEN